MKHMQVIWKGHVWKRFGRELFFGVFKLWHCFLTHIHVVMLLKVKQLWSTCHWQIFEFTPWQKPKETYDTWSSPHTKFSTPHTSDLHKNTVNWTNKNPLVEVKVVYPTIYRFFFTSQNGGGAVGENLKHLSSTTDRGEDRLEGPALLLTGYWMDQR